MAIMVDPIKLNGKFVSLEALLIEHVEALCEVGLQPSIWKWAPSPIADEAAMRKYVETALNEQARGASLPFVTREKASKKLSAQLVSAISMFQTSTSRSVGHGSRLSGSALTLIPKQNY